MTGWSAPAPCFHYSCRTCLRLLASWTSLSSNAEAHHQQLFFCCLCIPSSSPSLEPAFDLRPVQYLLCFSILCATCIWDGGLSPARLDRNRPSVTNAIRGGPGDAVLPWLEELEGEFPFPAGREVLVIQGEDWGSLASFLTFVHFLILVLRTCLGSLSLL